MSSNPGAFNKLIFKRENQLGIQNYKRLSINIEKFKNENFNEPQFDSSPWKR